MTLPAHEEQPTDWYPGMTEKHYEFAVSKKVAAERERCAKVCDLYSRLTLNDDRKTQSRVLAAEIRRGEIQVHQKGTV